MSFFFKLVALTAIGGTAGGSYMLSNMELPPPEVKDESKNKVPLTPRDIRQLPEINLK